MTSTQNEEEVVMYSRQSLPVLGWLLVSMLVGCGESGPPQYRVSGKVTFDGQPVKYGTIQFDPDKGNSGPQGYAEIRDGAFDTATSKSGVITGKIVVRINGFERAGTGDSEEPIPVLFQGHEVRFEMPSKELTKDFDVPKDAAKKGAPGSPEGP